MSVSKKIGLILCLTGIITFLILLVPYYLQKNKDEEEVTYFLKQNVASSVGHQVKSDYLGMLSIPKISLKKVIYPYLDKRNDVKNNIETLNGDTPDMNKANIILASHTGTIPASYFNRLKELKIGDKVEFYYQNERYQYVVFNKYEVKKKQVYLERQGYFNTLAMVTCIPYTNKQLVVLSRLDKIIN